MVPMKAWILFAAFVSLVMSAPAADPPAADAEVEVIDEIIAKVNGEIITRSDVGRARQAIVTDLERQKIQGQQFEKTLKERGLDLLRDRIDNLLLIQKGGQLDINVDQEVSKYMAEIMLQFKVVDQDKFAQLVLQQTGMRFEDFRDEVKSGMLTQRVLGQEVGGRIVIPREDIEKYYKEHEDEFIREERVFLSEILVSTDGKDADGLAAAEKKADDLVVRARRGEKFDELARENSDAVTADNGGDLGGWKKGDLRKDVEDTIWEKPKNYVTDPAKTDNGFLILKVMEHHQAGLAHIEEVEYEITGKLHGPLFEPKVREYLTQLRMEAFLEIKEGHLDSAAAPDKDTSWTDPAKLVPETVTREEVAARRGRKKLLWLIPIPGTKKSPKSSSR